MSKMEILKVFKERHFFGEFHQFGSNLRN